MRLDDPGNNTIFNHREILLIEECYSNGRPVHNALVGDTHGEMDTGYYAREVEAAGRFDFSSCGDSRIVERGYVRDEIQ